jgi:hypothetical protein
VFTRDVLDGKRILVTFADLSKLFEGRLAARARSHPGFLAQGESQPVRLNAASFATCESEKPGGKK